MVRRVLSAGIAQPAFRSDSHVLLVNAVGVDGGGDSNDDDDDDGVDGGGDSNE